MFHVFKPFDCFSPFAVPQRGMSSVASLFTGGEQGGLWLFDAAYQDSAGTTAADAQDDPVGLVLNTISGQPNAVQDTTASKPILNYTPTTNKPWLSADSDDSLPVTVGNLGYQYTAARLAADGVEWINGFERRNFLTWSEDFSQSVWAVASSATKSGNVCTLPNLNNYEGFYFSVYSLLPEREYKTYIVLTGNTGETVHLSYNVTSVPFDQKIIFTGSEQTLEFPVRSPSTSFLLIRVLRYSGDTATSITFHKAWTIDVTGLDPSEYPEYQKIESGDEFPAAITNTFDLVQPFQYNGGAFLIDRALSVAEKRAVERALKKYEPQAGEWP